MYILKYITVYFRKKLSYYVIKKLKKDFFIWEYLCYKLECMVCFFNFLKNYYLPNVKSLCRKSKSTGSKCRYELSA